jgi:hypothetical protein
MLQLVSVQCAAEEQVNGPALTAATGSSNWYHSRHLVVLLACCMLMPVRKHSPPQPKLLMWGPMHLLHTHVTFNNLCDSCVPAMMSLHHHSPNLVDIRAGTMLPRRVSQFRNVMCLDIEWQDHGRARRRPHGRAHCVVVRLALGSGLSVYAMAADGTVHRGHTTVAAGVTAAERIVGCQVPVVLATWASSY